jgi:hypothetical protein
MLRHKEVSGTQKETRVEQLTQYEDQSALGFFFNSAPGYAQPWRCQHNSWSQPTIRKRIVSTTD